LEVTVKSSDDLLKKDCC